MIRFGFSSMLCEINALLFSTIPLNMGVHAKFKSEAVFYRAVLRETSLKYYRNTYSMSYLRGNSAKKL